MNNNNQLILHGVSIGIDMDNVTTNWNKAARMAVFNKFPSLKQPESAEQEIWDYHLNFHKKYQKEIAKLFFDPEPGFYYNMEPIPGAIEAIKWLKSLGADLAIVTSPIPINKEEYLVYYDGDKDKQAEAWLRIVGEKFMWMHKYLTDMELDFMPLHAKHKFKGKYLVDDYPDAAKGNETTWDQIYFNNNYGWLNNRPDLKPQKNWDNVIPYIVENVKAEKQKQILVSGHRDSVGGC